MSLVVVNGKSFKMIFTLRIFRVLGRKWNLDSLPETMERISLIEKLGDGSLAAYDVLYDVLETSINCCAENSEKIEITELEDLPIAELLKIAENMSSGIAEAFPVPNPESEKKQPALKK